jgi:hypothetical protein
MKKKMAVAGMLGLGVLLVGAVALAGLKDTNAEDFVSINVAAGTADGVMSSARLSADPNQYIGCWIWISNATAGTAHASCHAADSQNHTLFCDTTAPAYVQAIGAINSDSWIAFSASSGTCIDLVVDTESYYSPKT